MKSKYLKCELCGSDIREKPVKQMFDGEEKNFCCDGCARVYGEAHKKGLLDQILVDQTHKKKASH